MKVLRITTICIFSKLLILGNANCATDLLEEIIAEVTPKTMSAENKESSALGIETGTGLTPTSSAMKKIIVSELGHDIGKRSLKLPKCLVGRDDIYSQETELARTIRKLEKADYRIKNETDIDQIVRLAYLPYAGKEKSELVPHNLAVNAGDIIAAPVISGHYLAEAKLESDVGYIDIFDTSKGVILSIEKEPTLVFPRPLTHTSFTPHPNRCFHHLPRRTQMQLRRQHCLDTTPNKAPLVETVRVVSSTLDMFAKEVPDISEIFKQREELYKQNRLEKVMGEIDSLPLKPRIPLNLFSIWFTSAEKPAEPDRQLLEFAMTSSRNNPPEEGWTHYFVTNDKKLIPNTVEFFSKSPIKVVELSELGISDWTLRKEINGAIAGRKMGLASDITRVELINKFGGAYLDIDFEAFQSLKTYFYLYDSLWGEEEWSYFLCNAFMAASPGHPAILEYINLIKRNFSEKQPLYIKNESDQQWKTIIQTGPGAESIAVYLGVGKPGYRDIIMPIQSFFPVIRHLTDNGYTPRHPCYTLDVASMHYYLGTWTGGSKYNSCG
jgi:hypothetical protein